MSHVLIMLMMTFASPAQAAVNYEFEPGADFSGFTTYAWVKEDAIPLASARPDLPVEETDRLLREAIDARLIAAGLTKVPAENAHLLVAYQGVVRSQVEVSDQPYSQSGNFKAAVVRKGTLTVDIVERSSRRLIWRASTTETALEQVDDPRALVSEMVGRVMAGYPPQ